MISLALALALAAPDVKSPPPAEAPPRLPAAQRAAPQALDSPSKVRGLCEALTLSERLARKGNVLERARAEAAHEARREVALNGRYLVHIAADRLRFADYDPDEKQLGLSDRTILAAGGSGLYIWSLENASLPVTADVAAAQRIMQAAARKTLVLALTFTLPDEDDVTCAHPNGSSRYSLEVDPYRWEYLDGGQVLARGGEGSDRPIVTAAEGARPRVRVSDPLGAGREMRSVVLARQKELEGCYERALRQNPALDGSLVAEVNLASGGVRIAADSLLDEAMTACVTGVISNLEYPSGADVRTNIPIHFELEPPSEGSASP